MSWNDLKINLTGNESPEITEVIRKHNDLAEKGKKTFSKKNQDEKGDEAFDCPECNGGGYGDIGESCACCDGWGNVYYDQPPKRRHKAQGSAPTQRINLSLIHVDKADEQAAKMELSRSAYIDWLIEKDSEPKVCNNCGCPNPRKTYDGYWCKMCHNEM